MPTLAPTDVEIRFYDRLTGERLAFNPDALVGDVSVELTSLGGTDNITCRIAAAFEAQRPPLGSLMDVIVLSDPIPDGQFEPFPRWRGILAQPEATLDTAESKTLLAYGLMEDMSRVPLSGTIADQGQSDLSQLAAIVLQSYVKARPWLIGRYESVIEKTGVVRDLVTVTDSDCRSALDAIAAESPGLIVWGWRVSETTGDFQFVFRARSEAVGNEFTVDGANVRRYSRPEELAKVENSVLITGAETDKPNIFGIITGNADFSKAENRGAQGANLLNDADFNDRDLVRTTLSGGASFKAGSKSEGPTFQGGSMALLDGNLEAVSKRKDSIAASLPDVGKPVTVSIRARRMLGTDTRVGTARFYWRSGGSRMPGGPHATMPVAPDSAGYWPEVKFTATRPTGADGVEVEITAGLGSGGLLIGYVSVFNAGRLVPVGWNLRAFGSATFNVIDPLYPEFWPGNPLLQTSLRVNVSATDAGNQDAHLETIDLKTGPCSGNQTLRLLFRARRTPGSTATTGKMLVVIKSYRANGEVTLDTFVAIPAGTFGDDWQEWYTDFTVDDDATTVTAWLNFRGDTDLLISCIQLRDVSAGNEFIRGANWERVVNAEDVCIPGSPSALSASVYDRRFGRVTNNSLKQWNAEAQAWAKAYLDIKAVPPSRARLALSHEAVQRVDPLDGKMVRLNGLSVAVPDDFADRVTYRFASALSLDVELGGESPSLQRLLAGGTDRQNQAVSAGSSGSATVASTSGSGALNDNIGGIAANATAALTVAAAAQSTANSVQAEVTDARTEPATSPVTAGQTYPSLKLRLDGLLTRVATLFSRTLTAGTGLQGGGDLTANRTFSVLFGTTAGTSAQGNDSRITGAAQKSANLSDLASAAAARANLGLGSVATLDAPASGNASSTQVVLGSDTRLGAGVSTPPGYLNTNSMADQALTTAYASVGDMSSVLSSAGTYIVEAVLSILGGATAGDDIYGQLYDNTNGAAIAKSENRITVAAANQRAQIVSRAMVTTAGPVILIPQVKNNTAARGSLVKTNSHMSWLQITKVDPSAASFDVSTVPGVILWMKAGDLGLANGAAVPSWTSALTGGTVYSQATAGLRPIYETAGINGQPAVKGTGSQYLAATSGYPAPAGDYCMYAVIRLDTAGRGPILGCNTGGYSFLGPDSPSSFVVANEAAGGGFASFGASAIATGASIIRFKRVSSTAYFRATGISESSASYSANGINLNVILARLTQGAVYMQGAVAEIIITSAVPADGSTADINIRNYLTSKYGLSF